MSQSIKISVIVPAYNVEPWIQKCINSICSQTYKNLELIVIDDGSTDNTAKIIDELAEMDSRIVAVHQKNAGLVATREVGIELATGDYITFVDADDAIDADMYERLLNNSLKNNADISQCGMRFCHEDGREELHYGTEKTIVQNNIDALRDLLEGKNIEPSLCNKLYRASLLDNSCLDTTILNNEDLLRNFVLFQRAKIVVYEDFCGYQYMQREGSMSKDKTKQIKTAEHIFRARRLIVDNCSEEIYPYAMRTWLSSIVNTVNQMSCSNEKDIMAFRQQCRKKLKEEKNNFKYLIKRQRVAANLIVYLPWLHRLIYQIYSLRYR